MFFFCENHVNGLRIRRSCIAMNDEHLNNENRQIRIINYCRYFSTMGWNCINCIPHDKLKLNEVSLLGGFPNRKLTEVKSAQLYSNMWKKRVIYLLREWSLVMKPGLLLIRTNFIWFSRWKTTFCSKNMFFFCFQWPFAPWQCRAPPQSGSNSNISFHLLGLMNEYLNRKNLDSKLLLSMMWNYGYGNKTKTIYEKGI